jgi:thiamine-phosphate pyrophosphorylase
VDAPRLILVTDPSYDDDAIVRVVEEAARELPAGAFLVQLRDKVRPRDEVAVFAARLREVTRAVGAPLVVNGDAALARDVGADGVHLGGGAISIARARRVCGEGAWISIAAHTDDAVRAAVRQGADAALVSPIFPTGSGRAPNLHETGGSGASHAARSEIRVKIKGPRPKTPRGLEALTSARAISADIALYALGGVTPETTRACVDAGADGVAVIRALLAAPDSAAAARAFWTALQERLE